MRVGRLLIGIFVGNGVAIVLVALGGFLFSFLPDSAVTVGLPSLLFVPFCVGLTAAWIWKPLELGSAAVQRKQFSSSRLTVPSSSTWPCSSHHGVYTTWP